MLAERYTLCHGELVFLLFLNWGKSDSQRPLNKPNALITTLWVEALHGSVA
jgi:hypothetical protein